jgi:hypothetical protein
LGKTHWCTYCRTVQPLDQFYKSKRDRHLGLSQSCRTCHNARTLATYYRKRSILAAAKASEE